MFFYQTSYHRISGFGDLFVVFVVFYFVFVVFVLLVICLVFYLIVSLFILVNMYVYIYGPFSEKCTVTVWTFFFLTWLFCQVTKKWP